YQARATRSIRRGSFVTHWLAAHEFLSPTFAFDQDVLEMRRMSAINHVVGRIGRGHSVHLLDCAPKRLPCWQPAIRFYSERERKRHPGALGRSRDSNGFLDVVHCNPRQHVSGAVFENPDLPNVIGLSLLLGHRLSRVVPVSPRTYASADDGLPGSFELVSNVFKQDNGTSICLGHLFVTVA